MFKWKDYNENSALFIDGISENVALLRHKDFRLTDCATNHKAVIKSSCLEEAKVDAENYLKLFWKQAQKEINKNLRALGD